MNWQEFEDRLKAQAQAQHTPVDTDALWNKIRAKKRRRLPLFWLFVGLGALLGSGGLVAGWFTGNQSLFSLKTAAVIPADTIDYYKNLSADTIDGAYFIRSTNARDSIKTSASKESKIVANTFSKLDTASRSPLANTHSVANMPANKFLFKDRDYIQILPISRLSALTENDRTVTAPVFSNQTINLEIKPNDLLRGNMLHRRPESLRERSSAWPSGHDKASIPADSIPIASRPPLAWLPNSFVLLPPSILINPLAPVLIPAAIEKRATNHPNHLYIGLQAGYYRWNIQNDSARIGEKLLAATQAGWQVQLPIGQFWSMRTGVQYTQYGSVFRWTRQWAEVKETPVLSYYINGNIDTTFSNILYQYERRVQHYNQLRSISIPLDVQYRMSMKHWILCPSAGLQLQAWQRASGVILNSAAPDAQLYPAIYQRAFSVGLRFGLSLEVPLSPRIRLVLEPTARMDLTRRTRTAYPAERFQQWGMNVGLIRRW